MSKRITQKDLNPFPFSDTNKRYHTYDYAMRHRYGGKCAKAILDAGFTCPNIDGTRGVGGCIYCSKRGSGDFANPSLSLREQYDCQRAMLSKKWPVVGWIPYLQAHTNTYAPLGRLKEVYEEILSFPDIVGLSIATRADCITPKICKLLSEVSEKVDLTVELGLQSIFDDTATRINRCHTFDEFLYGYHLLRDNVPRASIAIHLINGLPGEDRTQMIESAARVSSLAPDQIKLHLLHVIRGTALGDLYFAGRYTPLTMEEYVDIVVSQLERISPHIIIGRITGDGVADDLLAPTWSLRKLNVINQIDLSMVKQNTWQGRLV